MNWITIITSPEKLTDVSFMKEHLTQLKDLKELLDLLTKHDRSANRVDVINLLLANNGILENLCVIAADVGVIVNLLPEAKDRIIEKISTSPSILSMFVQNGGLTNLRLLFKLSNTGSQRIRLCETILTNDTLLIQSLCSISHLEEMIFTLTTTAHAVLPTVLANKVLLGVF